MKKTTIIHSCPPPSVRKITPIVLDARRTGPLVGESRGARQALVCGIVMTVRGSASSKRRRGE